MFVYPETMQTDAVEDFHEADSLQQHLDAMFAEDAPPLDWDTERQYTRSNLELYYLAYAAKPLSLQQLTEVCCSFGCTTLVPSKLVIMIITMIIIISQPFGSWDCNLHAVTVQETCAAFTLHVNIA